MAHTHSAVLFQAISPPILLMPCVHYDASVGPLHRPPRLLPSFQSLPAHARCLASRPYVRYWRHFRAGSSLIEKELACQSHIRAFSNVGSR